MLTSDGHLGWPDKAVHAVPDLSGPSEYVIFYDADWVEVTRARLP
jgi:hypothetical protein